ncbi:MAG: two-component regulator propeller domain-containing protein [Bacteroidota bacterium]
MPRFSFALLLAVSFFCSQLWAQPSQVQPYRVGDGLAQSQVYAVLADSRGYIWAGTQGGGLSRFDGEVFQTFSDVHGLAGNYVQALWEDETGEIWIGTERGLSIYDGATFENELADQKILSIAKNEQGYFLLTDEDILIGEPGSWEGIGLPKSYMRPYSLLAEDNRIILGTDRGAWVWSTRGKVWKQLVANFRTTHQIWALYRYQRGQSWALAPGGQLFSIGEDSLRASQVPVRNPTSFFVSEQGDSWLGTQDQGLWVLPKGGQEWQSIRRYDGLGSDHVRSITADRWGNIWVGTSGGGLNCIRQAPFRSYDQAKGLPGREVYAITSIDSVGVFFSVSNQGVYQLTANGPEPFLTGPALGQQKIKSLHRDTSNRWWMGTPGGGVKVYTDSTWMTVKTCGEYVIDLLPAGPDRWWVATAYEGLSLLTVSEDSTGLKFRCQTFGNEHQLPIGRIEQLFQDEQGRLLIAYRDLGLACWEPGNLHWRITVADGLPSSTIRSVRQDSTGHYWLASPRGLIRVGRQSDEILVRVFKNSDGLRSNNLYCLTFDEDGQLWVGSERGLDQVALDAAGNIKQVTFYGKEEGFTGIETCTDAAVRDTSGNLWIGTMNGLMLKENKPLRATEVPPPHLFLADVSIFYKSAEEVLDTIILDSWGNLRIEELELSHRQNHLGFSLRSLDLAQPERVKYEWMLENWDLQWSPPSDQSTITYANLAPGAYTFMVRAVGEGERRSDIIRLPVEIIPAFWQTTWFKVALIGGAFLLMALLLWWIFRRRLVRQRIIAEKLRLDNRLLELEQKALQLQMNPHFLANVLQGIQLELDKGELDRASQYLTRFGTLMRSTLYHSRASRIVLSEELEHLRHYLELERFRTGEVFNYEIEVPSDLETDLIEIPPMLLQPFLENAVHHGMRTKQGGGHIGLSFQEQGLDQLLVRITDNGPGLEQSKAVRRPEHRSTALKVIQERLELVANGTQQTPYQIANRLQDGKVVGVEVQVCVPVF